MSVLLPAVFVKPVFRVDHSIKLEFDTRELNGADAADLMDMRGSEGWLLFTKNPDQAIESNIPDERADAMTGQKTQAQRVRGVIFKIWEQSGKKGDFESYYKSMTERIIEQLKEKLE